MYDIVIHMASLVLVRHGESRWNLCNRFTGWIDVPLSENGIREAHACAKHCKAFDFSAAYTSKLERAHLTLFILLASQNRTGIVQHEHDAKYYRWVKHSNGCGEGEIPVFESSALNERYYGSLQGLDKQQAVERYGAEKVLAWRRNYHARPPGGGECLEDTLKRAQPFLVKQILPRVRKGEDVLLVGHGNTLRTAIKYLEGISDEDIAFVDLPKAHPLVYTFTRGKWKRTSGEFTFDRPLR
jgi:2,3-bisphosphoglycerate-dependent phosphoglycerate mutase